MEKQMKTELINAGFVKIGGDKLRVEAPVKVRDKCKLVDCIVTDPKTGKKFNGKRWAVTERGRKLRVRPGHKDEVEPGVWHFYQKQTRIEKNRFGGKDEVEFFALVKDSFNGTRAEAVAACISAFGGAV